MLRRRELRKEFIRRSILSGGRFISPAPPWEVVTVSGDIVTVSDAVSGENLVSCVVTVPFTEGGVQSMSVTRCGKNLANISQETLIASSGCNIEYLDGGISLLQTAVGNYRYARFKPFKRPLDNSIQLTLSCYSTPPSVYSCVINIYYSTLPSNTIIGEGFIYSALRPLITNQNVDISFRLDSPTPSEIVGIWKYKNIQLEIGSTPTDYEPYTDDTYTITMPADFYGGTIDLTTGSITSMYDSAGKLLPEPVVSSLTPIDISALAGVNNIWADAGSIEVKYYREVINQ